MYHDGAQVVDLWGGYKDWENQTPWEEDTLVTVFSTTKGISATCMALLNSRGLLDFDEKISTYWPEFAQEGKENVTVRQLLDHKAGLAAIWEELNPTNLADLDQLAEILARSTLNWVPGDRHGYHALSLGFFESELVRRVDPQQRSIGQFLQDEIVQPHAMEMYIGLPISIPDSRVAKMTTNDPDLQQNPDFQVFAFAVKFQLSETTRQAILNPEFPNGAAEFLDPNTYRTVEVPSANGIVQPRSVAQLYGMLAIGGSSLGLTTSTFDELKAPPITPTFGNWDEILNSETRYRLGYLKPWGGYPFGSVFGNNSNAFGTPGAGGSVGFADPETKIGFCYAMNNMNTQIWDDPRQAALRNAVYNSVGA